MNGASAGASVVQTIVIQQEAQPVWVRVPAGSEAEKFTGLKRNVINELIGRKEIDSKVVSGCRLVRLASLLGWVEAQPDEGSGARGPGRSPGRSND